MNITIDDIQKILEKDPHNAEAWRLQGDILLQKTVFYEALQCYIQAINLDQNYFEAWKGKGTICIFQNNTNDALQCFDRAIYVKNDNAEVFRLKSHAYPRNKENTKKISDSINKALDLNPNDVKILFSKSLHLRKEGLLDESLSYIDKVLSFDPNHVTALINKHQILNRGRSQIITTKFLTEHFSMESADVLQLKQFGDRFLLEFDLNLANDCYDQILVIVPHDYETLKKKFLISLMKLDLKNASNMISSYLQYNPLDTEAWTRKGEILRLQNRIVEAIECFDKAIQTNNKNAEAWRRKGFAQSMRHENMSDAINCLNRSLEIDSYHPMTYVQMARYLSRNKSSWNDSFNYLDKALEIDPTFVLAWKQKGDLFTSVNDYESASFCYDNILKLDPNDAMNWYYLGVVKSKHAEKEYQLGLRYMSNSNFALAISCFDKVLNIDSEDTQTLILKGDALLKTGEKNNALNCYKKAHEMDPLNEVISNKIKIYKQKYDLIQLRKYFKRKK